MENISLLLVHSGAMKFRSQVLSASSKGLLRRLILVNEDETFQLVENGITSTINLFNYLSQQKIDKIHLLAIRLGGKDIQIAPTIENQLAERLRVHLASVQSDFVAGTMALSTNEDLLTERVFQATWKYNLLISPEDWAGQPNFLPRDLQDSEYEDLAFAAATVITSSWNWIEGSVHDSFVSQAMTTTNVVRMARVVLRIIDAGDLAVRVTSAALDQTETWPIPNGCMFHPNSATFIEEESRVIASDRDINFVFNEFEPMPDQSGGKPISIREAVLLFFRMLISAMLGNAAKWIENIKQKSTHFIEDTIGGLTFGEDSEVLVRLGGKPRPDDIAATSSQIIGIVSSLPHLRPISPQPSPQTWRTLMAKSLGVFDGGESTVIENSAPGTSKYVVSDRNFVAPDPLSDESRLTISREQLSTIDLDLNDDLVIRNVDVRGVGTLRGIINPDTEASPEAERHLSPERSALIEKVDEFVASREKSLTWKLAVRLNGECNRALTTWLEAESELNGLQERVNKEIAEVDRLSKKNRKRQLITAIALLLLLAASVALFFVAAFVIALIGLLVFFSSVASAAFAFVKTAREQVRREKRLKAAMSLPEYLMKLRTHCHQEYVRLTALYEQFLDWADVIGVVLHHPYGDSSVQLGAQPYEASSDVTSFVPGSPDMNGDAIQGEKQRLRRNIVRRGWLNNIAQQYESEWVPRFGQQLGYSLDEVPRPTSDATIESVFDKTLLLDTDEVISSPRKHFVREVRNGKLASGLRQGVEDEIREVFRLGDPSRLIGKINCGIAGLNNTSAAEFLFPPIQMTPLPTFSRFMEMGVTSQDGAVISSVYGVSGIPGFQEPTDDIQRVRVDLAPIDQRFVLASFRLDLSREMNPDASHQVAAYESLELSNQTPESEVGTDF